MVLLEVLLVLLVLPVTLFVLYYVKYGKIVKHLNKIPGPPNYPLVGTTWEFIGLERQDVYDLALLRIKQYGPIFRSWLSCISPQVHLMKPEHFEIIMNNSVQITKGFGYELLTTWLGEGLLLSTGQKWHRNRKLITPAFHFSILEQFVEVFNDKANILVNELKSKAIGEEFDIHPYITHCTLDIICETAMGVEVNAMKNGSSAYTRAIYDVSELILKRILKPWLKPDFIYNKTQDGKRFLECLDILHGFTNKVLVDRKKSKLHKKDVALNMGKKRRLAFLDLLIDASENGTIFSDIEIRDEIDTFMFEGHDTTTAGICWTLFLLGNHQEIQDRVREELSEIFNGEDRKITTQDFAQMQYLECVIKESLRLYPSVPYIKRLLAEDVMIDNYYIPAGVTAALHIHEMHRNPNIYPDPDTFDPDRFLPEISKDRHPYAYVPFSAGPRNCIGQKFAVFEEKTILSKLLINYKVKSVETEKSMKTTMELILRPANGLHIFLERVSK